jgi:hypothetical protein
MKGEDGRMHFIMQRYLGLVPVSIQVVMTEV